MVLHIDKHKNILINILKDIFTDSTIGPVLEFKGDTARGHVRQQDRSHVRTAGANESRCLRCVVFPAQKLAHQQSNRGKTNQAGS